MKLFWFKKAIVILIVIYIAGCGSSDDTTSGNMYQRMNPKGEVINEIPAPSTIRNHELVKNEFDYSCGASALATILKYEYNEEITEEEVVNGLLTHGNREQIEERRAFSLLDMKKYLEATGYTGTGYKLDGQISFEQLHKDGFDSIGNVSLIPVQLDEYRHFVVFRAYDNRYVYLGDPYYGNICLTIDDFSQVIIDNIFFVVGKQKSSSKNRWKENETLMNNIDFNYDFSIEY